MQSDRIARLWFQPWVTLTMTDMACKIAFQITFIFRARRRSANSSGPNRVIKFEGYCVLDPDALETPAMVLFEQKLEHNIEAICDLVGGGGNLFAHVKTHKCGAVVRRQIAHGIKAFKCATLKELEMVLEAGASAAILAFPQVQRRKIERFCGLVSAYPDARVMATVSSRKHLDLLAEAAEQRQQLLQVMLDLDAGMHRTGIGFGPQAMQLYRDIHGHPFLDAAGLHLYDGHENYSDTDERETHAQRHIDALREYRREIESAGMEVPLVVAGGSWSFPWYARADGIFGSPGSFIYWDAGYRAAMPDLPFSLGGDGADPGRRQVSGRGEVHDRPGIQGDQFGSAADGPRRTSRLRISATRAAKRGARRVSMRGRVAGSRRLSAGRARAHLPDDDSLPGDPRGQPGRRGSWTTTYIPPAIASKRLATIFQAKANGGRR